MFNLSNSSNRLSPEELIMRMDRVKRDLLREEGLVWTDLLVLSSIKQLSDEKIMNTPGDVINKLSMNRNWVYRSLRKLQTKNLIYIHERPKQASHIGLSGMSNHILMKVEDCFIGL